MCGIENNILLSDLHREAGICIGCGSSVRMREIVQAVNMIVKKNSQRVLSVVGLSDAEVLSNYLSSRKDLIYTNTFIDDDPILDISDPTDFWRGRFDIVISSDVFEHVMPPLSKSLEGVAALLAPDGWLVLTMPWTKSGASVEHYPWMKSYEVDDAGQVIATKIDGQIIIIENPIFHGGPGKTLEMRFISIYSLIDNLEICGFKSIEVLEQDSLEVGIKRDDGNIGTILAQYRVLERPQ